MNIMKYFAFAISILFVLLGIAILSGFLMNQGLPKQFKIMVGIVLVLYGIFRFLMTLFKKNQTREI